MRPRATYVRFAENIGNVIDIVIRVVYNMVMKYIGLVCSKHPDEGGLRYKYRTYSICVKCAAEKAVKWRDDNAEALAIKRHYNQRAGDRKAAALSNRISRLNMKAVCGPPNIASAWPAIQEEGKRYVDLGIRFSFLRKQYEDLAQHYAEPMTTSKKSKLRAYLHKKFRENPEYEKAHNQALDAIYRSIPNITTREYRIRFNAFWRDLYRQLDEELFPVVQSDLPISEDHDHA